MDKVYLIPEHQLDLVNLHILNAIMDGLQKELIDFELQTPITYREKNNWETMKGLLRYYIELGFRKWLKVT